MCDDVFTKETVTVTDPGKHVISKTVQVIIFFKVKMKQTIFPFLTKLRCNFFSKKNLRLSASLHL